MERMKFGLANRTTGTDALTEVNQLLELGMSRVVIPALLFGDDPTGPLPRYHDDVIGPAERGP